MDHNKERILHLGGAFQAPVPRSAVWEFLLNPKEIAPCMPHLQSLDILGPDSFKAKVGVGLSVVRGNMDFQFRMADKVPSSAKLIESRRGVGSTVDLQTPFTLDEVGSGTKVCWVTEVTMGGIIAGHQAH